MRKAHSHGHVASVFPNRHNQTPNSRAQQGTLTGFELGCSLACVGLDVEDSALAEKLKLLIVVAVAETATAAGAAAAATAETTTEKVDGLRSLHKQSSTLKSAKHSAKSSLAHAS